MFKGSPKSCTPRREAKLYLTDDTSCIPDVQYYLCVKLYGNVLERRKGEEGCKAGEEGGYTHSEGGLWGEKDPRAQLLN